MSAERLRAEIEARLEGHTDRDDEAFILERLAAADAPALDGAMAELDLAYLIGDLDDRRFGPDHRTSFFRLMFHDRLPDLSVPVRARWVNALSQGNTDDLDERGIHAIVVGTRGAELTELKNAIDRGSDHRHLLHVVHSDIDDDHIRAEILRHFANESASVGTAGVKVLSDIDDTFYCNWKDERFPSKTVYPGVLALYEGLSSGGEVVFVTARPEDRTGQVEASTQRTLRARGVKEPVVLAGSFTKLHSHGAMATEKLKSFVRYAELFGEYEFVFVGDSGQGDAAFGAAMREHAGSRVRAVLIHDVVATPPEVRAEWAEKGVDFFDTYVGAARRAQRLGLLDEAWVTRVRAAAEAELTAIGFESPDEASARADELVRDWERAQ